MLKLSQLEESSIEDKEELLKLATESRNYISSQKYIKNISEIWLDRGWGDIMAVFYITGELYNGQNFKAWSIAGDLPPGIIGEEFASNGARAIQEYLILVKEWALDTYTPQDMRKLNITVPHIPEYINMLEVRSKIIYDQILSQYTDELENAS